MPRIALLRTPAAIEYTHGIHISKQTASPIIPRYKTVIGVAVPRIQSNYQLDLLKIGAMEGLEAGFQLVCVVDIDGIECLYAYITSKGV